MAVITNKTHIAITNLLDITEDSVPFGLQAPTHYKSWIGAPRSMWRREGVEGRTKLFQGARGVASPISWELEESSLLSSYGWAIEKKGEEEY